MRRSARPAGLQGGREHGGGERQQGGREEQAEVRPLQVPVDTVDARERVVVVEPDDADVEERADVGDVRAPEVSEVVQELPALELGHGQVEHEQRDRDREDAVGERLDAAGVAHEPRRPSNVRRFVPTAVQVVRQRLQRPQPRLLHGEEARQRPLAQPRRDPRAPRAHRRPPSGRRRAPRTAQATSTAAATSAASSINAFACSSRRRRKRFADEPPFLCRFLTKRDPTLEVTIRSPSSIPTA